MLQGSQRHQHHGREPEIQRGHRHHARHPQNGGQLSRSHRAAGGDHCSKRQPGSAEAPQPSRAAWTPPGGGRQPFCLTCRNREKVNEGRTGTAVGPPLRKVSVSLVRRSIKGLGLSSCVSAHKPFVWHINKKKRL